MPQPIVFYDIPSQLPGSAWSPNTWKVRLALNYKGIPYKTQWIEYPDIAGACKEIGAAPTNKNDPLYTLPVIHDPNTKITLSESGKIVRYLDKTYPDTPVLIPAGTSALHAAFEDAFSVTMHAAIRPFTLPATARILNPRSEAYYRATRLPLFGDFEEWAPPGPKREKYWKEFEEAASKVAGWTALDGSEQPFFTGDQIAYADLIVGALLIWAKKVLDPEHGEWTKLRSLDNGRWGKLSRVLEKYETVN